MASEGTAMTNVTILPVPTEGGGVTYCAVSNGKRSEGATAGEALDAIRSQMTEKNRSALVILQQGEPDAFFMTQQQERLSALMEKWRNRDRGSAFSGEEYNELRALIEAEIQGAGARAAAWLAELKR